MTLTMVDLARVFVAITLLIVFAHVLGQLFAEVRQPSVVGEILAGVLLGPTLLGAVAPSVHDALFPSSGPTASVLGAIYQFGLIFLIFLVGGELPHTGTAAERWTVVSVTVTGLVIPFGAGILVVRFLDIDRFSGPSGSTVAFALVFGSAIAVTSIPVISRIMLDLGILGTPFARVVLSIAVLEDIALYVILAVILGLVQSRSGGDFGLWALFGSDSVALSAVYHVSVSVLFLGVFLAFGGKLFRALARHRFNILERRSPVAFRIVFLLLGVLASVSLGINSVFGALMAGYATARGDAVPGPASAAPAAPGGTDSGPATWDVLKKFLLAFFVPAYFALVGVQLDLLHHLPLLFFLWFFVMASGVKLGAVWLGARVAGETSRGSLNLAVAMNARGGPGIVLATVTFTAGIINEEFFTVLVLLSILTSQAAGIWLDRAFGGRRARVATRSEDAAPVHTPHP